MSEAEKACLRKIEEKDLEMILTWRNSERIRAAMFTDQIITADEHRRWYGNIKNSDQDLYLIFEYNKTPRGLTCFNNIDNEKKTCFWGFYIGGEDASPGLGTKLAHVSLQYAFFALRLRKVYGKVFVFNTASTRLFKKLGFKEEGYYKKHVLKNGCFEDVVIFSLASWEDEDGSL